MGCGCKADNGSKGTINNEILENKSTKLTSKIGHITFKVIVYLLSITIFFIIIPYIFWVLFKAIVLSKDFNLVNSLKKIIPTKNFGKYNKRSDDYDGDDDEDDDDYDDDEENEFGEHYDDLGVEVFETTKN